MEKVAKLLEDSLLIIWNDRDSQKRLDAMKEVYATDIAFYETNESLAVVGHQAIDDLIANLQTQWPIEFKFELNRPSKANHQIQQISWNLGIHGQTPIASGMDVAIVEDNKIKSLYLLLDTVKQ